MKTEEVLVIVLIQLPCMIQMTNSYKINDVHCNECPAGTYLVTVCNSTAHPDPICLPCKLGVEYQPDENMHRKCGKCKTSCRDMERMEITKNCTTKSDAVCECKLGFYKQMDGPHFVCIKHKECTTDEALVRKGDREMNYICEKCLNGSTYWESSTKPCQSCTNCSTELCKPFCMQADPVTTEKTAGLADWAIALIIVLSIIVVAVVVVLIVLARYKKGPKCLRDCWYGQSSTSDQENPPESDRFLPNGQTHDETDVGAQQSNQSTSQVPVSAQQTDGIPSTLLKDLSKDLISREWQFFFRALFPDGSNVDKEIERVQIDYQNNIAEQIYQMLLVWKQKEGCRATMDRIVDVMKNEKMHSLADKYKDFCQAPSQPNGRISYPRANGHSIDVLPTAPPADDVVSNSGNTTDSTGPGPVSENGHIGINGTL